MALAVGLAAAGTVASAAGTTVMVCNAASQCIKIGKDVAASLKKVYDYVAPAYESYVAPYTGYAETAAKLNDTLVTQRQQLNQELEQFRKLVRAFDKSIQDWEGKEKTYGIKICSLDQAENMSKLANTFLNNFEGKINKAQNLAFPQYYRTEMATLLAYFNASVSLLELQTENVRIAIELAERNGEDEERRRYALRNLQSRYNSCR